MSPAAVDMIALPPIEPPTPAAPPPSATDPGAPSFREHLQRAERRTGDADSSERDRSATEEAASSTTTESRAPQESQSGEKPAEKKSDDATAQSDAVSPTKEKQQGEEDADEKATEETGAECIVAAIVAPQEVDATQVLKVDVVEVAAATAEPVLEATADKTAATLTAKTAAEAAAIVVQTAPVEGEAVQAVATEEVAPAVPVTESQAEIAPTTAEPIVTPQTQNETKQTQAAAEQTAAQPSVAETIQTTLPVATAAITTAAVATDEDPAADESTTPTKVEATAATQETAKTTVDAPAQQAIAAAVESVIDVASGTSDEKQKRHDDRKQEGPRVESRTETSRVDRPHLPEQPRNTNGREVGGARAAVGEGSTHLSQSDRVRLVERVARAVRTAEQRGGDLKIRLSPPELGSLRLQIKLTDGVMSARIEAETPEARQVLVDNLPQLREKLSDQNIRVERFDIDLFNSGYGGAPQQSREEHDQAMQAAAGRNRNRETGAEESVRGPTVRSGGNSLSRSDGRLDITI